MSPAFKKLDAAAQKAVRAFVVSVPDTTSHAG